MNNPTTAKPSLRHRATEELKEFLVLSLYLYVCLGAIIINSANNFDTATMFVPIIVLMVMAIGLNTLIGYVERKVAPWQAEIAGRERE